MQEKKEFFLLNHAGLVVAKAEKEAKTANFSSSFGPAFSIWPRTYTRYK